MAQAEERADAPNPIELFHRWYDEAAQSEPSDASAVALATIDGDGAPSVRMVLLKDASDPFRGRRSRASCRG